METLLSHSFDYLTSPNPTKIRKGLRQLEGLLAQICLSRSPTPIADKRRSMITTPSKSPSSPKSLQSLSSDLAYLEFFKLQQSFQFNVSMRLISCLERLLGKESNGTNDLLVVQCLDLMQGVLLLHPLSRQLFEREIYMNLLLDLLDPASCPAIHIATLLTLVTALLSQPQNTRTFESLDGLLVITSLSKSPRTSREVKLKLIEFMYFYLMPESSSPTSRSSSKTVGMSLSADNTAVLGGRGKELVKAFEVEKEKRRETLGGESPIKQPDSAATKIRSTQEKQEMLGKYLSNVQDLVDDLREGGGLFGVTVS